MKISLRFLTGLLTTGIIVAFAGSVSGVLAWFVYSNRATISYSGTTIYSTESLQIGMPNGTKENPVLSTEEIQRFGLVSKTVSGVPYVFEPVGETLESEVITQYLVNTGFTAEYLTAASSNKYASGDALSLTKPVTYMENTMEPAEKKNFVTIPLVFRVPYTVNSTTTYAKGQNVYLTDIPTHKVNGVGDLSQAIRVYVDTYRTIPTEEENEGVSKRDESQDIRYLLAPSATEDGETRIGGILDLNGDGYYDYDPFTQEEILYGSYSGTGTNITSFDGTDSLLSDINHTGENEPSTFLAKHRGSVTKGYVDYSGITFDTASYLAPSSIFPADDGMGHYTGGKPVCVTSEENGLGRVDFTLYLEGWDLSLIDRNLSYTFQLGFEFSINKVSQA